MLLAQAALHLENTCTSNCSILMIQQPLVWPFGECQKLCIFPRLPTKRPESLAKLKEALCLYLLQAERYCAISSQGPALGSTVSSSCCSSSLAGRQFTNYEPSWRHNFSAGDWRVCCTVQPRLAGGRSILQLPGGSRAPFEERKAWPLPWLCALVDVGFGHDCHIQDNLWAFDGESVPHQCVTKL
ncbi:hypothetical protein EJ110_NYTH38115 [Nymphaea thermarum]|nr:hypothetical protein EJ110_NYTH38115 [Nymphaea thermarum]